MEAASSSNDQKPTICMLQQISNMPITLLEICTRACTVSLLGQNRVKMEPSSSNYQKAFIITGAVFQHVPTWSNYLAGNFLKCCC